jgi:hypothetical protein
MYNAFVKYIAPILLFAILVSAVLGAVGVLVL